MILIVPSELSLFTNSITVPVEKNLPEDPEDREAGSSGERERARGTPIVHPRGVAVSAGTATDTGNTGGADSRSSARCGSEEVDAEAETETEVECGNQGKEEYVSLFVEDLYFVAKDGPLDSVHSKAMSWVLNKISSEAEFDSDLTDEVAVENLRLRVVEKHPHKLSTSDLVQMYIRSHLADQLFLIDEEKEKGK